MTSFQRQRLEDALEMAVASVTYVPITMRAPFLPDGETIMAALPIPLWEDLLVAIDHLPDEE